jgi:hypothetical protein
MRYCILFIACFMVLASCQKTPTATTSREDVLRNGNWKLTQGILEYKVPYDSPATSMMLGYVTLTAHNYDFNGDTIVDIMRVIDTIRKDDYFTFGVNNYGLNHLGLLRSSIAQPDSIGFNWYLTNDGNTITFANALNAFSFDNIVANFTDFNSNSFTIKYYVPFQYIKYPYWKYAPPVQAYHDTTWVADTVFYKLTYSKF